MDSETSRKYHISRKNILEILRYRGYEISKDLDMTLEEFTTAHEDHDISEMKNEMLEEDCIFDEGGPAILVLWISERKLGANIRDVNDKMIELKVANALIVADMGVTPMAKETIRTLRTTKKMHLDVWNLQESMIFVPAHELVPEHRILSAREKKAVYTSYGLRAKQQKIPMQKYTDIMVRYLGASRGNVIEIIRPSETDPTKKILTYRLVV